MARWNRIGALRRLRRRQDLSQRDLAQRLGVSPSTIARAESADSTVSLDLIEKILALGDLRLAVVDADGQVVAPMNDGEDVVRDHSGRRFPAHLDVQPADELGTPLLTPWHPDRRPPQVTYHHRALRDRPRTRRDRERAQRLLIDDHLTDRQVAAWRRQERDEALAARRLRTPWVFEQAPDCRCFADCHEVRGCLPGCICQCEPVVAAADIPDHLMCEPIPASDIADHVPCEPVASGSSRAGEDLPADSSTAPQRGAVDESAPPEKFAPHRPSQSDINRLTDEPEIPPSLGTADNQPAGEAPHASRSATADERAEAPERADHDSDAEHCSSAEDGSG